VRNAGKNDWSLNLGMMLANENAYPKESVLILTVRRENLGGLFASLAIAGRVDPLSSYFQWAKFLFL